MEPAPPCPVAGVSVHDPGRSHTLSHSAQAVFLHFQPQVMKGLLCDAVCRGQALGGAEREAEISIESQLGLEHLYHFLKTTRDGGGRGKSGGSHLKLVRSGLKCQVYT